jgi:hypothetical protein
MTLAEFKAWFEGYTEGLEGAPTAAQFARIKEKVALIDGTVTTYPVFLDRYVYPNQWRPYWDRVWYGGDFVTGGTLAADNTQPFNSTQALYELGKMEAHN